MPRLRPWGFPTVSPSHPSLFPHHGIRRITVEFSEDSQKKVGHCEFHLSRRTSATASLPWPFEDSLRALATKTRMGRHLGSWSRRPQARKECSSLTLPSPGGLTSIR